MLQRDYELTFVLSTTLDEEASTAVVERINGLIGTGGGAVTEMHAWGRRRLAYPIAHQRDGFYVTTRFSMPTRALDTLENDLRLQESILRHLIVRQDEVPLKPLAPAVPAAPVAAHAATARPAEPPAPPIEVDAEAEGADADESFDDAVAADEE